MKKIIIIFAAFIVVALGLYQLPTPSNERKWTLDQQHIPTIKKIGNSITIENVRDFQYRSETDYDRKYNTIELQLEQIKTVDFILSQFAEWRGLAHAFVSFGIENENGMEYIAISVEIRKEEDEEYSPFLGILKQYELAYVIATETDVVQLRTNHRHEPVYLYPMDVSPAHAQALFINLISQAHQLETQPEFYNTITNSCMSNLAKHVNQIKPELIPFGWRTIFPGYADDLIVQLGLLSSDTTNIADIRKKHLINDKANTNTNAPFSLRIRQ